MTLLALAIGLAAAALLVAALLQGRSPGARGSALAVVIVGAAGLGVGWPAKVRDNAHVLNHQRSEYSATAERSAREKCLNESAARTWSRRSRSSASGPRSGTG